jgi:hypothetical protein
MRLFLFVFLLSGACCAQIKELSFADNTFTINSNYKKAIIGIDTLRYVISKSKDKIYISDKIDISLVGTITINSDKQIVKIEKCWGVYSDAYKCLNIFKYLIGEHSHPYINTEEFVEPNSIVKGISVTVENRTIRANLIGETVTLWEEIE